MGRKTGMQTLRSEFNAASCSKSAPKNFMIISKINACTGTNIFNTIFFKNGGEIILNKISKKTGGSKSLFDCINFADSASAEIYKYTITLQPLNMSTKHKTHVNG